MLHATNITMAGADELIDGTRNLLDSSGSPAFCAVARLDDGEVIAGACAFGTERPARDQARTLRSTIAGAAVFIAERRVMGGRVRWTIWHGDRDERVHQAFEEAPETWV